MSLIKHSTQAKNTKIAQIFGQYDHPVQPYLASWSRGLEEQGLDIFRFDFNEIPNQGAFSLGAGTHSKRIRKFIHNTFLWPGQAYIWGKHEGAKMRRKAGLWAEYGPLIACQPNTIHLVNSFLYPKFSELMKHLKIPLVVSFRGHDLVVRPWVDEAWKRTLPALFDQANVLHFVSEYLCNEAVQLGAPREKCRVIYPSIDLTQFSHVYSIQQDNGKIKLVSTGRLVWQKNFPLALQVVKQLIDRGLEVDYTIIGEGIEREHLTFLIRVLDLENHVQLKGQLAQNDVRAELQSADIYFQPSETETISVAVMEAAAMGKAIVASKAGGLPEAIQDQVTGLLVPPYDVAAMTEAVDSLARDAALRDRMGKAAEQYAVEHFSTEVETKEWLNLYCSL